MLNYIKSELYRVSKSRRIYMSLLIMLVATGAIVGVLAIYKNTPDFPYAVPEFSLSLIYRQLSILTYVIVWIVAVVDGDEYKNHTFKNVIASGQSRKNIFIGRFIVHLIVCMLIYFIVCGLYALESYCFLNKGGTEVYRVYAECLIYALPVYVSVLAISHVMYIILSNPSVSIGAIITVTTIIPSVLKMAGYKFEACKWLSRHTIPYFLEIGDGNSITDVSDIWSTSKGMTEYLITCIVVTIFVLAAGLVVFKKKDIK